MGFTTTSPYLAVLALFIVVAHGFYIPGVSMQVYKEGETIPVWVNKLTSSHTLLPYSYYAPSLGFCKPAASNLREKCEVLGEVLRGDTIASSVIEITAIAPPTYGNFAQSPCRVINNLPSVGNKDECTYYSDDRLNNIASLIENSYRVHWILDNLPAAYVYNIDKKVYSPGFLLGESIDGKPALNNHVDITVVYSAHRDGIVVIGFEVRPRSIPYDMDAWNALSQEAKANGDCPSEDLESLLYITPTEGNHTAILWTYTVSWEFTDTPWSKRWDTYLASSGNEVRWFSMLNSVVMVLFMSMMIARVLCATLRNDLDEEPGWKLVHGDVFRPPSHPVILSLLVGSGVQLFATSAIMIVLCTIGFFSPAQRGMLSTIYLAMFASLGLSNGYCATRCYKCFMGENVSRFALKAALAVPGAMFALYFVINVVLWANHSSLGIPFGTMVTLVFLWLGIHAPCVLIGSGLAHRRPQIDLPVSDIPRQIPRQTGFRRPTVGVLLGGIIPFSASFIELCFVTSSMWGSHLYYSFGFLLVTFVILIVVCAEISILICYYQLDSGNYHWWWRAFLTSGASAFYVFLYSIFFFSQSLTVQSVSSTFVYFGFSLMLVLVLFVLTGTIGFYACNMFVRKIYAGDLELENETKLLTEDDKLFVDVEKPSKALSFLPAIPLTPRDLLMDIVLPERRV